jgi:outer membrane protein TolC
MNNLKTLVLLLLFLPEVHGQTVLSLQDCYNRAIENYPLIKQRYLIERTRTLSIENASRAALPNVMLGGQATYQSEVTQIPGDMPGVKPLSRDQYRVFGEISQTLYHGGLVNQHKATEEINANIEQQKLDVDLYQIKNRINDLYFGILLLQEQASQSELVRQDLNAALKKTEAAIVNGTALKSAGDVLRAEVLLVDQRVIEMQSAERAYRDILALFINQTIDDETQLTKPVFTRTIGSIDRPELKLFEAQKKSAEANYSLFQARKKPRVELYIQGGYGRPGLNMLENSFTLYGLGGLRFSWLLSGYYTTRNEKEIFTLRQQSIDIQKEAFLFNTDLSIRQHESEIAKYRRLMDVDDQIISLRKNIRETAAVQLEQGVITSTDFIREVNAEDQAKKNRLLHEIQWLTAEARYQFSFGQ